MKVSRYIFSLGNREKERLSNKMKEIRLPYDNREFDRAQFVIP